MFTLFERLLKPTDLPEEAEPPPGFIAFFWHFARQAKGLFVALFAAGFVVALLDSTIPVFMGRIITLITATPPDQLFATFWPHLAGMAVVLLIARPIAQASQNLIANQAIAANVSNRIRWQNHWYVVRQSWAFFQNDFAGRIANRVMQTGPAIRETLVALITSVWYILVYGTSALILLSSADPVLALPVVLWFLGYLVMLRVLVPRMRDRSKAVSEGRSMLTGRIVDSYTNILTVKLFARAREEDAYVRDAIDQHTELFYRSLRLNTLFSFCLSTLNAMMVTGTGGLALVLWTQGKVEVGTVAMALPLAWQIVNVAGWVALQVTSIFENIGVIQEGMMTIARPIALIDRPDAPSLDVTRGEIVFEDVRFGEDRADRPLRRRQVDRGQPAAALLRPRRRPHPDRRPGHRCGHAGEPACANLHGHAGHLAAAPLDRRQHPLWPPAGDRRGGRRGGEACTCARVHPGAGGLEAASRLPGASGRTRREAFGRPAPAHRHCARDPQERADPGARRGHVSARQRSGGRDPIEPGYPHGGQDRDLSTIARMDRLIVLDRGRIVEQGTHHELLQHGGHYAALWRRQSGGFIDAGDMQAAE